MPYSSERGKSKRQTVTRSKPCELCEGIDGCSTGDDGLFMCRRRAGETPGFIALGKSKGDDQFALYRRADDPRLSEQDNGKQRAKPTPKPDDWIDWPRRAQACARNFTPEARAELAGILGLPEPALDGMQIGLRAEGPHRDRETGKPLGACWTFPEYDGTGEMIGITCRYADGRKLAWPDGKRGLCFRVGWREHDGAILCPEGASDTLALVALGLPAIGRPNNTSGAEMLAELLKDLPAEREIVVLGEYDNKPDGKWPGLEGAKKVSAELASALDRPVSWAMPPDKAKDVRVWVRGNVKSDAVADEWSDAGERFAAGLQLHPAGRAKEEKTEGYQFAPIDSATFFARDYRPKMLIKRVMVAGQPAVVGGSTKTLKTSIDVDLAISLDSGTPFLDEFQVYERQRVCLISGESGEYTLQETGKRICAARGLNPLDLGVEWDFRLPQFGRPQDLNTLREGLQRRGITVCIIDPLYLCLLAGFSEQQVSASNFYQVGPLLLSVSQACLSVGCTPILTHHTPKHTGRDCRPLELQDLAFAGISEFARQWLLISRREPFERGIPHRLYLVAGGSVGHGGLWDLDIDEGVLDDDFNGRKWDVIIADSRGGALTRDRKEGERKAKKQAKESEDDAELMHQLDRLVAKSGKPVAVYTHVREATGFSNDRMSFAVMRLKLADMLEEVETVICTGKNLSVKRNVQGLRRTHG